MYSASANVPQEKLAGVFFTTVCWSEWINSFFNIQFMRSAAWFQILMTMIPNGDQNKCQLIAFFDTWRWMNVISNNTRFLVMYWLLFMPTHTCAPWRYAATESIKDVSKFKYWLSIHEEITVSVTKEIKFLVSCNNFIPHINFNSPRIIN